MLLGLHVVGNRQPGVAGAVVEFGEIITRPAPVELETEHGARDDGLDFEILVFGRKTPLAVDPDDAGQRHGGEYA